MRGLGALPSLKQSHPESEIASSGKERPPRHDAIGDFEKAMAEKKKTLTNHRKADKLFLQVARIVLSTVVIAGLNGVRLQTDFALI